MALRPDNKFTLRTAQMTRSEAKAAGIDVGLREYMLRVYNYMAIGLAIVAMLFVFFGKLRRIIGTVGEGDPFQPENATRLSQMGWLMLGTQLAIIPAGFIALQLTRYADAAEKAGAKNISLSFGNGDFDMTALLLVVILFILARVFRHGAAMREDLEGTV